MSEHYPKSTLTATAWCLKCNRYTDHRIDDGRKGPCLDKAHPEPPPAKETKAPSGQKDLFEK